MLCRSPKGMWGAINPPMAISSEVSVNAMMPSMVSNDSSLSAMWAYMNSVNQQYNGSAQAMNWGSGYNVSAIPEWAQSAMMDNIMYTRAFLAMNPDILTADGHIDMASSHASIQFPSDINSALNNDASGSAVSSSAAPSSTASSSSAAPSATQTQKNGARTNAVSGALVGAAAIFVSFLAL